MEQLAFEVVLFDGPYQFRVTEIDGQLEKVEAWQLFHLTRHRPHNSVPQGQGDE